MDGLFKLVVWLIALFFIVFYPMLISMYVFLPLFVGTMGYMFIVGIEQGKLHYMLLVLLYIINLEANLSLPFFMIFIAILLVYVLFYQGLKSFRNCMICRPVMTVFLVDVVYLFSLLFYDFLFQTQSIVLDSILLYSLLIDLLLVVIL